MKTETLLWLFPVFFMIHEFEEIIMMQAWVQRNKNSITTRFPKIGGKMIGHYTKLSTASFSLAIFEEFLVVAIITFIAVEYNYYALWTGMVLAFVFHLVIHIIQTMVLRQYTPAIITSILTGILSSWLALELNHRFMLNLTETIIWFGVWLVFLIINLQLILKVVVSFERWLQRFSRPESES
ncbi:MAG: HXXEE domain-containing protein [Bacteroidetes bacterium]|nr:HXXEE domain-containing protein [Bacteroidota bacterium]